MYQKTVLSDGGGLMAMGHVIQPPSPRRTLNLVYALVFRQYCIMDKLYYGVPSTRTLGNATLSTTSRGSPWRPVAAVCDATPHHTEAHGGLTTCTQSANQHKALLYKQGTLCAQTYG